VSSPPRFFVDDLRRALRSRQPPEGAAHRGEHDPGVARHRAARGAAQTVAQVVILVLAAAGSAVAGMVFLVLLPICGIAFVAEAVARACWGAARHALSPDKRGALSQH
jgi:hypothetical protein